MSEVAPTHADPSRTLLRPLPDPSRTLPGPGLQVRASTSLMGLNFSAFVLYWLALLCVQYPTKPGTQIR